MKKRWKRNENGSTLVELMTAFLILLLVAEAMLLSVSGYSKTVKRYREIYEAGNRLERHMGDAEYGEPAEIHLAVDGEEFLESGYFAEETFGYRNRPGLGILGVHDFRKKRQVKGKIKDGEGS